MNLDKVMQKISDFSSLVPEKKKHKQIRNKIKEQLKKLISKKELVL
jgi:hypothetical protein